MSFGQATRKRFQQLRMMGQNVPKIMAEVSEGATIAAVEFQSAGSREPDQQTFTNSKHLHITFLLQSTKYHNIFHLFIQTILQLTLKSRCEPPTEFMFT